MYNLVLMAALMTGGDAPAWCHGCHGCNGCWSSCHGCRGCHGCWGGCHGCYGGYYGGGCYGCYGGCYGCYGGCYGCYGGCYGCYGGCCCGSSVITPYFQTTPTAPEQAPPPKKTSDTSTRAKLVVELPKDATLFIDDQPMKATTDRRAFRTPVLDKGQAYFYDLRVEINRDGKVVTESKRVIVRAGQEVTASFKDLQPAVETAQVSLTQK